MTNILGEKLFLLSSPRRGDVEAWVVNSVKVKMIKKLDKMLEPQGRINARKLFLVPVFTIPEIRQRVEEQGAEVRTLFYRELMETVAEAERKFL